MKSLSETDIIAKYPEEIAQKLISTANTINDISQDNNSNFAIRIEHHHYIAKDKNKATSFLGIDNSSDNKVKIIKELKNPNVTHKYNAKKCIKEISVKLDRENIALKIDGVPKAFNKYHFNLFCDYFGIKNNEKLCYVYKINAAPTYSYSYLAIDFIATEIKKDPENIIQVMKNSQKNK